MVVPKFHTVPVPVKGVAVPDYCYVVPGTCIYIRDTQIFMVGRAVTHMYWGPRVHVYTVTIRNTGPIRRARNVRWKNAVAGPYRSYPEINREIIGPEFPVITDTKGQVIPGAVKIDTGIPELIHDGINGLLAIDVSMPGTPILIDSYNTDGTTTGVFISENYIYIADGESEEALQIFTFQ